MSCPSITPINNLTGRRFGRLEVRSQSGRTPSGNVIWNCACDCGSSKTAAGSHLLRGNTKSCGCFRREHARETKRKHFVSSGDAFGRITVRRIVSETGALAKDRVWRARCQCGSAVDVNEHSLIHGGRRSCGCLFSETRRNAGAANRTHGLSQNPLYNTWKSMIRRCTNPSSRSFKDYGGRGIRVCAFIAEGPDRLFALIGERPDGMTLDRADNNGSYTCGGCEQCRAHNWPMNLRWATRREQVLNRRPMLRHP